MQSLVITIVGPDRPGLVESLSRTIASHGGSWVESSLSHLAGQFAGVVRATVDESSAEALQRDLTALTTESLHVVVQRGTAAAGRPAGALFRSYRFRLPCIAATSFLSFSGSSRAPLAVRLARGRKAHAQAG